MGREPQAGIREMLTSQLPLPTAWGQVPRSPDMSTVVVAGNTYLALTVSQVPFSALCKRYSHSSGDKTEAGALIIPTDEDVEPQRH